MEHVKDLAHRLMANPVFWVAFVMCALTCFIRGFQQYTHLGVDGVSWFL